MILKLVDIFGYLAVVLRAGTLICQSLLLGGLLFLLWIARSGPEAPENSGLERVRAASLRMFRAAAIALVVVQVLYLYVNSAVLMATADIGISEIAGANFFIAGSVILIAALLVAVSAGLQGKSAAWLLALLVLMVLGASVTTNHAAARMEGRVPLIILTVLHEACTGFWIGGLPFLLLGVYVAKDRPTQWYITQRFSRLALVSVIVLVLSGLGMSLTYIGSFHSLIGTSYGVMVLAKIMMLAAMLALGAINFLMLRKYSPDEAMPRLRRLVEAEVGIGITIVLAAASLTSQAPAADQPDSTVDLPRIVQRLEPAWPRMESPQAAELSTKYPGRIIAPLDPSGAPAAHLTDGTPISARVLNDMKWSEYNHHWMGIIVVAMGLLAVLARTGHAKWAEYWPLLMIGIAIFIFLRGDPECWPLGPRSFWATWAKPEVFQHRLAALLCIAFAIFELRVRRRPSQGGVLPLIFPLLCAVGAALLLTHSHGTANVEEEFMAELNHAPMAVLGVMAGWSRWLELRLPPEDRTIPAWIWPVCFVLIGAGLLNYREI
jgi:putative copper resistance protein D